MKLMNLFMVMLLLTGRAVLAETSSVTDREWLKQQENLSEQLRQHPDKQLQQGKRAARTVLTGMCYSVGSATRQGSSSPTRFIGQSAMTSRT